MREVTASLIQSQGGIPSWVSWLQSQSLSYQLPLPIRCIIYGPLLYLLQSPRCRLLWAETSPVPWRGPRAAFSLSSSLLPPSSSLQPLWAPAGSACGTAGPLFPPRRAVSSLPSHSRCLPSSWLFEQSRAASTAQAHHPLITAPAELPACMGGYSVYVCVS